MNIEDIIKNMVANAEEVSAAKNEEKDFANFMEGVLKDIFGEGVKFEKVKEVDDGKNDIHIEFKPKGMEKEKDIDNPFDAAEKVLAQDDKEIILHAARTIAHKHRNELPVTATYTLLAAFLSKKAEECKVTSLEAFKRAQKRSQSEKEAEEQERKLARKLGQRKFKDFFDKLSEEEGRGVVDLLNEMYNEE